ISFEGGNTSAQGIMVDEQSYAAVVSQVLKSAPVMDFVWVRANDASLASVRLALAQRVATLKNNGRATANIAALANAATAITDRLALLAELQNDPLALNLLGVLTLGTITPLLLALLGSLLLSWMSVRNRLTSFAVLR